MKTKLIKILSCMTLSVSMLAGCTAPIVEQGLHYTHLVDKDTQTQVTERLVEAGIPSSQVDTYMEWVNDFNTRVETPTHLASGFQQSTKNQVDYTDLMLTAKQAEDGRELWEANCRLSAYLLFKNLIHTDHVMVEDAYLMFDLDAIDTMDQFAMSEDERGKFITLFNPVTVEEERGLDTHVASIEESFMQRGLTFVENNKVTLINLYLHDPYENKRLVGHTGLLIDTGSHLLFVEKYGPFAPFQVTAFKTEQEMMDYLLARPDIYSNDGELAPIITKNNKVISTY
ncbi:MAG: DUF4300 family protein [Niameybacter sp.]|uniref:DUF4300 family protein n=1 Tax=Niameybacter sp. TaxID=2033640 RepID=UPI002FC6FE7D